jgi:CheY-like chemotaxis protein
MSAHRILVVDDDADVRESLIDIIQDSGYEAIGAVHGQDALDRLRADNDRPCIILLDLMMPVMDGWQFREAQRNDPELANIPVVVISAYRHRPSVTELDAAEYINKPVQIDSLMDVIRRHCPDAANGGPG